MIKLYSYHPKEGTVCQKTVHICPLGRLTRWNWTIFIRNAHTCSSLSRTGVVRQQRAYIWHAGIPRCISQAGELQWRSKGRWASMLHKHPFLSLMASSPYLRTFHWMCLYISLCVCPVNTLMHTHRFSLSFVHLSLLKGGIWLVTVKTLQRGYWGFTEIDEPFSAHLLRESVFLPHTPLYIQIPSCFVAIKHLHTASHFT